LADARESSDWRNCSALGIMVRLLLLTGYMASERMFLV
jgi:hypothetical protein